MYNFFHILTHHYEYDIKNAIYLIEQGDRDGLEILRKIPDDYLKENLKEELSYYEQRVNEMRGINKIKGGDLYGFFILENIPENYKNIEAVRSFIKKYKKSVYDYLYKIAVDEYNNKNYERACDLFMKIAPDSEFISDAHCKIKEINKVMLENEMNKVNNMLTNNDPVTHNKIIIELRQLTNNREILLEKINNCHFERRKFDALYLMEVDKDLIEEQEIIVNQKEKELLNQLQIIDDRLSILNKQVDEFKNMKQKISK